jgi:hypothetical protein
MAENTQNKYISPSRLSLFLDNLKDIFSPLVHTHKISEISDYVVDSQLSSTSNNPVQNKVIDAEFDAISQALNVYDLALDDKVDKVNVVDNLTTTATDKPLSANQGNILHNQITTATTTNNAFTVQLGTDGTVGGYKTGDVIAAGTNIQTILNKLLQKAVPATYTKPTISLVNNGGTASGNIEAGSTITLKLRASFTKNDAGNLTNIAIKQGSTSKASGATTPLDYNGSDIVIGDETITFTASATYNDAPVKNNNLGEESKENWFAGGTITSSSYSFTGKRKAFYGTGSGSLPTVTSSVVRGLSGSKLAPANGTSFNVNVAVGQQYIVIAYPSSLRDINNITYVEANDSGMASNFTKSTVQVADARGGTNGLVDYKVYTYAMTVPAAATMTFKVTI